MKKYPKGRRDINLKTTVAFAYFDFFNPHRQPSYPSSLAVWD